MKKGSFSLEQTALLIIMLLGLGLMLYVLYKSGILTTGATDIMKSGGASVPIIMGIKWK